MARVYLTQDNEYKDITNFISTIKWEGGISEAARKLEITLINGVLDKSIPDLYIKNGSLLKLFDDDGKLLIKGFVFFYGRASTSSSVSVTSYDHLIYLLKNRGVYNFKNKTAEEITDMICNDFQIPKGSFAVTGIKQSFIANKQRLYDMSMKAYTHASRQNGKKYLPRIIDDKLHVIEMGNYVCKQTLHDEINITDSSYTESIENMVNRVKIYSDKDVYIGTVENKDWINSYGLLQEIYTKEKEKEPYAVAKGMLTDAKKIITVEAIGNIECITGHAVKVKDSATGLTGFFYIEADRHTWANGQHIMRLSLNFKKIMDERG